MKKQEQEIERKKFVELFMIAARDLFLKAGKDEMLPYKSIELARVITLLSQENVYREKFSTIQVGNDILCIEISLAILQVPGARIKAKRTEVEYRLDLQIFDEVEIEVFRRHENYDDALEIARAYLSRLYPDDDFSEEPPTGVRAQLLPLASVA